MSHHCLEASGSLPSSGLRLAPSDLSRTLTPPVMGKCFPVSKLLLIQLWCPAPFPQPLPAHLVTTSNTTGFPPTIPLCPCLPSLAILWLSSPFPSGAGGLLPSDPSYGSGGNKGMEGLLWDEQTSSNKRTSSLEFSAHLKARRHGFSLSKERTLPPDLIDPGESRFEDSPAVQHISPSRGLGSHYFPIKALMWA